METSVISIICNMVIYTYFLASYGAIGFTLYYFYEVLSIKYGFQNMKCESGSEVCFVILLWPLVLITAPFIVVPQFAERLNKNIDSNIRLKIENNNMAEKNVNETGKGEKNGIL